MIRSPNLNVIIKALDKVSSKMARDFGELENLQGNNFASSKFANATYLSIKEKLVRDLNDVRPDFNFRLLDGEVITKKQNSKFTFVICVIDGLFNFSRSLSAFSNVIAIEEEIDGKKEITTVAINNIAGNELLVAQKGSGAYLNNRRIRISQNKPLGNVLCAVSSKKLTNNDKLDNEKYILQLSNCNSLDLANLASGKVDLVVFEDNKNQILDICSILIREAGGSIDKKDGVILAGNNKLIK